MTELNKILQGSGINTIPPPQPITIILSNGKTGDFQGILNFFGISRTCFDSLSLKGIKKLVTISKENLLLAGLLSDTLQDHLNFLIEVKESMEGGEGE